MIHVSRREFLASAAAALAAAQSSSTLLAAQHDSPDGLPKRPLGTTGEQVTIICLGGWDIGTCEEAEAISIMHEAIDEGLTFFDNCWDYHKGGSEEKMGKALAQGSKRDKVFLMTKVCGRDYTTAKSNLEDSLRRLRTDRIDLWQFHGTQWDDDPELIFAPDGALKAALEAKKEGKIRYIGFTGHKHPKYHLAMLEQDFAWDTVQMPLNILDAHYESFQKQVLPKLNERKIGVLGMKALGAQKGRIPRDLGVAAEDCRRYVLSLPISSLVCGIASRENLQQDLAVARNFKPMTEADVLTLLEKSKEHAADGHIEQYKLGNYGCDWYHRLERGGKS
ncbi:MAG: aldo/keto reductase [Planctomycetota bacterium]